jgi:hypothetical protein
VFQAELAVREVGLSLEEALQLVLLYAAYEPAKLERDEPPVVVVVCLEGAAREFSS